MRRKATNIFLASLLIMSITSCGHYRQSKNSEVIVCSDRDTTQTITAEKDSISDLMTIENVDSIKIQNFIKNFRLLEQSLKLQADNSTHGDSTFYWVPNVGARTIEHNGYIYIISLESINLTHTVLGYLKYKRNGNHYDLVKSVPNVYVGSGEGQYNFHLMDIQFLNNDKELMLMFSSEGGEETVVQNTYYDVWTLNGDGLYEGRLVQNFDDGDTYGCLDYADTLTYSFDQNHYTNGYPDMKVRDRFIYYKDIFAGKIDHITDTVKVYKYNLKDKEYKLYQ